MSPITFKNVCLSNNKVVKICLGDIFIATDTIPNIIYKGISNITTLAALTVGLTKNTIYFILLGLDGAEYNILDYNKNKLILLYKSKKIKISKDDVVQYFKRFAIDRTSTTIDDRMMCLQSFTTTVKGIGNIPICKSNNRLVDISEWPTAALIMWARYHLTIPEHHLFFDNNNKQSMIDDIIKMHTSMVKNKLLLKKHPQIEEELPQEQPSAYDTVPYVAETDYTYAIDIGSGIVAGIENTEIVSEVEVESEAVEE
jgi:hypothetical protein